MTLARKLMMGANAAPPGGGITMTAGNGAGFFFGYNGPTDPLGVGPFGSLSGQPLAGQTMTSLWSFTGAAGVYFSGDTTAALAGKSVTVNGTPYALINITYDGSTYTTADLSGVSGDLFADGVAYTIDPIV